MKKNFPEELDKLIEDIKQEFNKLKHKKNRRWVFFIPLLIPLFFPELFIFIIIFAIIYFACNPKKD